MKWFIKFGLVLIFNLVSRICLAQINESDTLLMQFATAFTGSVQTGNIEAIALRAKADFSFAPTNAWAFKTQNSFRYQEFYDNKADNDLYSRNFFYLWQHRRVYPFAMAFVSTNFRRKIDFRYFAGGGATWQLLRRPGQTVKTALSGVYESSRFTTDTYNYPEYDGSDEINTWRVTAWLFGKHTLAGGHLRLYYEAFLQPSLEHRNNFRWQTEVGLEWPVWKGLSFAANYLFTHENIVAGSVKPDDRLLTFGVSYTGNIKPTP